MVFPVCKKKSTEYYPDPTAEDNFIIGRDEIIGLPIVEKEKDGYASGKWRGIKEL